ncbi:NUDIX hydrolase [Candidatus Pacearchaeota archaeon]|nr:NUDIX hydrolase [Candidatus Pacearchaeota archaeon]
MKDEIVSLFAYDKSLSFTEIKNKIGERSSHVAYWLKKLLQEKIIRKSELVYQLTEESEHNIPYLSRSRSALPVVLVHLGDAQKAFLSKRKKRPYKGLLGLPGGRVLVGESIEQAAVRIMKSKHGISIANPRIEGIALEHMLRDTPLHTFVLFLVKAQTKDIIPYTALKNTRRIIKSDYALLKDKRQRIRMPMLNSVYA